MSCLKVIEMLQPHLRSIGVVVIAGGAVRDELLGTKPKDYDAFVLAPSVPLLDAKISIGDALSDVFGKNESNGEGSSVWIATEADFEGVPVQVIASQCASLNALLDTFDWNICLFGMGVDAGQLIKRMEPGDVFPGGILKLHTVTNPLSTLRRGFRFCERYQMLIHKPDLVRLCSEVLSQNLIGELHQDEPELEVAF